ncbi:hypothetical protein J3F84DRAFT_384340 [Trichoderma pleuroticola]
MNCCSSRSQISASSHPAAAVSPASPDTLSIRRIARRYAGEQILVSPISWTSRHLELLGVSFQEPIPAPSNTNLEFPQGHDGSLYVKEYLRAWWKFSCRLHNIQRLLAAPECPLYPRAGGTLHFDRLKKKLYCTFLYHQSKENVSSASGWPVAAYADLGELESLRKDTLRCYTTARFNPPGQAIWHRKWKRLNPPEPLHDPYIVALLIAVAQKQRNQLYKAGSVQQCKGKFFSPQVVCSLKSKECLYLYTADISSSLLDMFDDSSISPPTPISTSIEIRTIPISPPQTLRARLLTLLCPSLSAMDTNQNLDGEAPNLSMPTTGGHIDPDQ